MLASGPIFIILFLSASSSLGTTITVFRNTLDPTEFGTKGGAILVSAAKTSKAAATDAATICFRFNLKVLAGMNMRGRGTLLNIGDWYVAATIVS
jgi:hypothetical protein